MFTVTSAQALAIFAIVDLVKTGIITYAQYRAHLDAVLNMSDEQLDIAIKDENIDSDLLMKQLDNL